MACERRGPACSFFHPWPSLINEVLICCEMNRVFRSLARERFMYATHNGSKLSQNLWKRVSVANNYVNYTFVCSLIDTLVFKVWLTVFRSFHLVVRGNCFLWWLMSIFPFILNWPTCFVLSVYFCFIVCICILTESFGLSTVVAFFSQCHQGLEARDL